MSTLSKVFVVLLVVFSIAFTSMTVSIATQTVNWKETAGRIEEHARVADTALRHQIAVNAVELVAATDTINAHLDKIAANEAELQRVGGELEKREAELRRAASEKSGAEAINRGLIAQLQSIEAAREEYRKQRDQLETEAIGLQRRNIDLNDRVNELTAQTSVLVEQKRQFEQQINVLKGENQKLSRLSRTPSTGIAMEDPSGAAMSNVVAVTPVSGTAIRGKIVDVAGDIVTISVGAADGVQKEMVFVIHRQGEYVGDLKVSLVDPNKAAGRILGSRLVPAPGDMVTDELGLGGSRG